MLKYQAVFGEDVILEHFAQVRSRYMSVSGRRLKTGLLISMGALLAFSQTFLSAGAVAKSKAKSAASSKKGGFVANFQPYPPMVNPIRIGIACRAPIARFAIWAPGYVFLNREPVFELQPGLPYSISNGRITELGSGKSYDLPADARVWVTASDYRVWTNNRWYRGSLELINMGGHVTVINLLDLEDYLLGVVPSEMPASWHPEALKAQAVAARSYAIAHLGTSSKWQSEGYDLVPDVRDQAYKGLGAEASSTFQAVQMTRGLILKDSGKVKPGFYRAWVGDQNENLNIRKTQVEKSRLEKLTGVPNIVGVTVKRWDAAGNAQDIQVMGTKKSREVYGVALAKMLGLSTAGVLDVQEQGNFWVFTYRGPGNGSRGLSQHGANMLATNGWRFDQILQQYYQDNDGKLRLDYVNNFRAMMPAASSHKSEGTKKSASKDLPNDSTTAEK
jgi:peptidoglycan hydrolase-like amidase